MSHVDPEVRASLFDAAERVWREHRDRLEGRFSSFVPTDYELAYEAVRSVTDRGEYFIELGSGAGVVTILADLLGFEAHGIEIDDWLVSQSMDLAEQHGSEAQFAAGSFVPMSLRDSVQDVAADFLAEIDGADAYAEIGLDLADFDVIYDYHWPEQADLHADMLARCARPGAVVLRFSAEHGFDITTL